MVKKSPSRSQSHATNRTTNSERKTPATKIGVPKPKTNTTVKPPVNIQRKDVPSGSPKIGLSPSPSTPIPSPTTTPRISLSVPEPYNDVPIIKRSSLRPAKPIDHDSRMSLLPRHSIVGELSIPSSPTRRRSIRFKDELSTTDIPRPFFLAPISFNNGTPPAVDFEAPVGGPELHDIAYFETLMEDKDPWSDANYLSGLRELFTASEIWLTQEKNQALVNSVHRVLNKDGLIIYKAKKIQSLWWTGIKFLFPFRRCRKGFSTKIYSLTGSRLVKFVRRSHCFATQQDIVEAFYGREESYVGRIERSSSIGLILKDHNHQDIYRLVEVPKKRMSRLSMDLSGGDEDVKMEVTGDAEDNSDPDFVEIRKSISKRKCSCSCCSCISSQPKEMRIFRTDTREPVGHVVYKQERCYLRKGKDKRIAGFRCTPDVGTNAKVLLIGAMFFLIQSKNDGFSPLPLGNDAYDRAKHRFFDAQSVIERTASIISVTAPSSPLSKRIRGSFSFNE